MTPRPVVDPTACANTHANYEDSVGQFEVVGANLAGGVNATTSFDGKGALIAVAVVPRGDVASISGSIGGDTGAPFPISATNIPEPAAIGVLGLGAVALGRRRRAAERVGTTTHFPAD